MILILQLVAIALLSGTLGAGYGISGQTGLAVISIVLGLCWAAVDWFGIGRSNIKPKLRSGVTERSRRGGDPLTGNFALLLFIGLAAWGVWQRLPTWLMLGAVFFTLIAWDLSQFSNRMMVVIDDATAARLERVHLSRLGIALSFSLLLGGAALFVHIQLDIGWALVLGMLAMIGLNRFVRGLSR
jgi:hypothetical protein